MYKEHKCTHGFPSQLQLRAGKLSCSTEGCFCRLSAQIILIREIRKLCRKHGLCSLSAPFPEALENSSTLVMIVNFYNKHSKHVFLYSKNGMRDHAVTLIAIIVEKWKTD